MRFFQVFPETLLLGNKVHDVRKKENTEQSGGQSQLLELKSSLLCFTLWEGLPWWLRLQCGRPRFNPWVGKMLWRRKWQPTPVLLPGGWRNMVGYSPWGCKESDTTEQLHSLGEGSNSTYNVYVFPKCQQLSNPQNKESTWNFYCHGSYF